MVVSARQSVFISYSHRDQDWLNRIDVHLRPLAREQGLSIWSDARLDAGSLWRDEIDRALASARVAVLVVSADFLASDFIATDELPPLLEASRTDGAVILPLIVSPSRYLQTPALAVFQAINDPTRPLSALGWHEQEDILVKLANRIEEILRPSAAPTVAAATKTRPRQVISDDELSDCLVRLGVSSDVLVQSLAIVHGEIDRRLDRKVRPEDTSELLLKLGIDSEVAKAVDRFSRHFADASVPTTAAVYAFYLSASKVAQAYKANRADLQQVVDDDPVSRFMALHRYWLSTNQIVFLPSVLLRGGSVPTDPSAICYFTATLRLELSATDLDGLHDAGSLLAPRPRKEMYAVASRVFMNPDPLFYQLVRFTGTVGDLDVTALLSRKHIQSSSMTASALANALSGDDLPFVGFGVFRGDATDHRELHPFVCTIDEAGD